MDLESARELFELRRSIVEAKTPNVAFEALDAEQRLNSLGSRVRIIATQSSFDKNEYAFRTTVDIGDGIAADLIIEAYYKRRNNTVAPLETTYLEARWTSDGELIMHEQADLTLFYENRYNPSMVNNVLNRLYESVQVAEQIVAG